MIEKRILSDWVNKHSFLTSMIWNPTYASFHSLVQCRKFWNNISLKRSFVEHQVWSWYTNDHGCILSVHGDLKNCLVLELHSHGINHNRIWFQLDGAASVIISIAVARNVSRLRDFRGENNLQSCVHVITLFRELKHIFKEPKNINKCKASSIQEEITKPDNTVQAVIENLSDRLD